jgi:hypothetical protein
MRLTRLNGTILRGWRGRRFGAWWVAIYDRSLATEAMKCGVTSGGHRPSGQVGYLDQPEKRQSISVE